SSARSPTRRPSSPAAPATAPSCSNPRSPDTMPTVTFIGPNGTKVVEAEPGETLLDLAERHDVMMGSACGGVCACSSCHCYVRQGLGSLPEMSDAESDRLDMGFDVRPYSRLGCQTKVG